MEPLFQEQLIQTIQHQSKVINDMSIQLNCMDMKINDMDLKTTFIKSEIQAVHWNIGHLFGLCNEIKQYLINKMEC